MHSRGVGLLCRVMHTDPSLYCFVLCQIDTKNHLLYCTKSYIRHLPTYLAFLLNKMLSSLFLQATKVRNVSTCSEGEDPIEIDWFASADWPSAAFPCLTAVLVACALFVLLLLLLLLYNKVLYHTLIATVSKKKKRSLPVAKLHKCHWMGCAVYMWTWNGLQSALGP